MTSIDLQRFYCFCERRLVFNMGLMRGAVRKYGKKIEASSIWGGICVCHWEEGSRLWLCCRDGENIKGKNETGRAEKTDEQWTQQ